MKSISILGCGWLGIPLAKAFLKEGAHVKGSVTSIEKKEFLREQGIEAYVLNLANEIIQVDFFISDVLIVAVPPRQRSKEAGVYKHQIKKLIDYVASRQNIKHVIYTSSTSVYKDENRQWKEEDLTSVEEAANEELYEVEKMFLSLGNRKVSILRLGGLTGGSRMLAKHFAGRTAIVGGGNPVNLVHLEDVVSAIQLIVRDGIEGVYNLCSPQHPSKKVFYTQLCNRFGLVKPDFQYEERLKGKAIDSSKIQAKGFSFQFPDPFSYSYEV